MEFFGKFDRGMGEWGERTFSGGESPPSPPIFHLRGNPVVQIYENVWENMGLNMHFFDTIWMLWVSERV